MPGHCYWLVDTRDVRRILLLLLVSGLGCRAIRAVILPAANRLLVVYYLW